MILFSRFKRGSAVWVINPYKARQEPKALTPKVYRDLPCVFSATVEDITKSAKLDESGRQVNSERIDVSTQGKSIHCIDTNYVYRTEVNAKKILELIKNNKSQNEIQKKSKVIQYEELNENKSLDTTFATEDYDLGDEIAGKRIIEIVCNCYVTFYITLKDGVKLLHRFQSSERRN